MGRQAKGIYVLFNFYPKTSVGLGAIFLVPGNPGIPDKTISIVVIKNNVGNCFVDFGLVSGPYEGTPLAYILKINCIRTARNTCINPEYSVSRFSLIFSSIFVLIRHCYAPLVSCCFLLHQSCQFRVIYLKFSVIHGGAYGQNIQPVRWASLNAR